MLLKLNRQYKEYVKSNKKHLKFRLYTDEEIGFPSTMGNSIIETVSLIQ